MCPLGWPPSLADPLLGCLPVNKNLIYLHDKENGVAPIDSSLDMTCVDNSLTVGMVLVVSSSRPGNSAVKKE